MGVAPGVPTFFFYPCYLTCLVCLVSGIAESLIFCSHIVERKSEFASGTVQVP